MPKLFWVLMLTINGQTTMSEPMISEAEPDSQDALALQLKKAARRRLSTETELGWSIT